MKMDKSRQEADIWAKKIKRLKTRYQINGEKAKVIKMLDNSMVDVEFESGTIVRKCTYIDFYRGFVIDPAHCGGRGEWYLNRYNHQVMEIIMYKQNGYVDVQFENGLVRRDIFYGLVRRGLVSTYGYSADPNEPFWTEDETKDYAYCGRTVTVGGYTETIDYNIELGEVMRSRSGVDMKVVGGNKYKVKVKFEDGSVTDKAGIYMFRTGRIAHPTLRMSGANGVSKSSKFCTMDITKIVLRQPDYTTYYECKCRECGQVDILTPQEMLEHKCNNLKMRKR